MAKMEDVVEEIERLLNANAYIEFNCADDDIFSISVAGKCINITNDEVGCLNYSLEDDT